MIDWLIIGGGIHGTYLCSLLTGQLGVRRDDVRVLDPNSTPLACWTSHARNCGMRYLRSSAAHNIDLDILSLYRFAKSDQSRPFADFVPPYLRPSLTLFKRHCVKVIHDRGLATMYGNRRNSRLLTGPVSVEVITSDKMVLIAAISEGIELDSDKPTVLKRPFYEGFFLLPSHNATS